MPQIALAGLLGALIAVYGNQLADPFWFAFSPLLLPVVFCQRRYRLICVFACVFLWSSFVISERLAHRLPAELDGRGVAITGIIADLPALSADRSLLLVDVLDIRGQSGRLPERVRLSWYSPTQTPRAGERWLLYARLREPTGLANPAAFDSERWLFANKIDAVGTVLAAPSNRRLSVAPAWSPGKWRQRLSDAIDAHCVECRYAGLIKALVLGQRSGIDSETRHLLQASGTAHLLAISGLHIGMVASLCYGLGAFAWRLAGYRFGINRQTMACLVAFAAALVYAALAGFSLPTQRALVMLTIVVAAQLLGRRLTLPQVLSLAAVVIIVLDPIALVSASFWLSFAAVAVIAFALFRHPRPQGSLRRLLTMQLYFTVLFAPVGILVFGQWNPASLPANLVAIPLTGFVILPLALTGSLLAGLSVDLAEWILIFTDRSLGYLLSWLQWLLDNALQSRTAALYPPILMSALILAALALLLPRVAGLGRVALALALVLLCWRPERPGHGEFDLLVLDVGMGTSALLRTRHHSLVYDLGPGRSNEHNVARFALFPGLRYFDIDTPDLVVVSHVDQDHSGGLYSLRPWHSKTRLLSGTPGLLRQRYRLHHPVRDCHEYPAWRWDGVEFSFLDSHSQSTDSSNDRSCVLQVRGSHRLLMPGDIENRVEQRLVERYREALVADILLAPHHGSATSSSAELIAAIDPAHVVFTMSRDNRWGFPDTTVVARYFASDVQLWRSDLDGAVRFQSRRESLTVDSFRDRPRRHWQRW